jgi:hypothetical protein
MDAVKPARPVPTIRTSIPVDGYDPTGLQSSKVQVEPIPALEDVRVETDAALGQLIPSLTGEMLPFHSITTSEIGSSLGDPTADRLHEAT